MVQRYQNGESRTVIVKEYDLTPTFLDRWIKRSLSVKGSPYDNAVAEATFKTIKTEFVHRTSFDCLDELSPV